MIKSHFVEECKISFPCKSPGICWMDFPLAPTPAADSNMQIWERQIYALYKNAGSTQSRVKFVQS